MSKKYQITRAAELETLAVFRRFLADVCRQEGIDEDTCFDLQLAVDEASTNVITHGYRGMDPGSLCLSVRCTPRHVKITLTDFGHPFEPAETAQPDLEAVMADRPSAGFGLFFIYQSMDEVDYETMGPSNVLRLVKHLQKDVA